MNYFVLLLCSVGILVAPQCKAATDDLAFSDCRNQLNHDPNVMPGQIWFKPPVDPATQKALKPELKYLGTVLRWTDLQNPDGSETIVVMTRDTSIAQPEDDPDDFEVFMNKDGVSVENEGVGANAFAFSAYQTNGVVALYFCTRGKISPEWDWDGKDWG